MAFNFGFKPSNSISQPAFTFGSSANPAPSSQTSNAQTQPAPAPIISSTAQIDLQHLRPTTKFDQLTPDLQKEIEGLDGAILNQINLATEVSELLPAVAAAGETIPSAVELVNGKIEELETALENDAEAIVDMRDGSTKKSQGEAKCVFRAVDRLKVPRQYQVGHSQNESISGGIYGGGGLSGWWNNPQTMKGSLRAGATQGQTMQLPGEDVDDSGPKSLVELFNTRSVEMTKMMQANRELLGEIEAFVGGLEGKVRGKERELNERLNYGTQNGGDGFSERDHQMQLLRYVFGEVDRSLYEVAGKVGGARDDVAELGRKLGS